MYILPVCGIEYLWKYYPTLKVRLPERRKNHKNKGIPNNIANINVSIFGKSTQFGAWCIHAWYNWHDM